MVFSSIPAYLDPSNWQQQQNHQIIGSSSTNPLHPPPPAQPGPPPPPPPQPHGGGATGSIRPNSMADRARLANIQMPEAALECPRCESTNTKFCYFNNYSLKQPRHFCKTCRRYWTRGGALRNVPVGGGCRRNKRSKSTGSKSSPASSDRQTNPSSATAVSDNSWTANTLGLPPQLPLSQLTDNFNSDVGLNYSGITSPAVGSNEMSFHGSSGTLLGGSAGGVTPFLSSGGGGIDPWWLHQVQQFPYLSGLGPSRSGIVQFQGGESGFVGGETSHQARPRLSGSMLTQLASVKMEGNPELNLSRHLLEGMPGNDQWNTTTAAWTELSGFSSSSRANPL